MKNELSPGNWGGHEVDDGCNFVGFLPIGIRGSLSRTFSLEAGVLAMRAREVIDSQRNKETITSGTIDPRKLPLGSVLVITAESLSIARKITSERGRLLWCLSLGLKQSNYPWGEPKYDLKTYPAIVAPVERYREIPIQGLLTFGASVLRRSNFARVDGYPRTEAMDVGVIKHGKYMDKLQANDRQSISRITEVQLYLPR